MELKELVSSVLQEDEFSGMLLDAMVISERRFSVCDQYRCSLPAAQIGP